MSNFLIVYKRSTGELQRLEEFDDLTEAMTARRRYQGLASSSDIEVVLLRAESEEALQRTHGRYFKTAGELVAELGTDVA